MGTIVTGVDEAYLPGLKALYNSYLDNSVDDLEFCSLIHGTKEFADHVKHDLGINIIHNPSFGDAKIPGGGKWAENLTAMYSRLLIPQLFEDRTIWVDADCIILETLKPLLQIDLNTRPVAACVTSSVTLGQQIGGLTNQGERKIPALFAGLLVFNTPVWNNSKITERCIKLMNTRDDLDFKYVVQSVLSYILKGNFITLPYEWQVFANRVELSETTQRARVLHYVGHLPWEEEMKNMDIWNKYA